MTTIVFFFTFSASAHPFRFCFALTGPAGRRPGLSRPHRPRPPRPPGRGARGGRPAQVRAAVPRPRRASSWGVSPLPRHAGGADAQTRGRGGVHMCVYVYIHVCFCSVSRLGDVYPGVGSISPRRNVERHARRCGGEKHGVNIPVKYSGGWVTVFYRHNAIDT